MKSRKVRWLVLLTALLTACIPAARAPSVAAHPTDLGNLPPPAPAVVGSPDLPAPPGCYYAWATRDLPELTARFRAELAELDAGIQASAYAFGEECRADGGTVTFLPMETDFRVRIPVTSLADDASLGAWISRAMSVVMALPVSEVPGTRPGRVEYEFHVDDSASLRLVVDISRYRAEAGGLSAASILQLFQPGP